MDYLALRNAGACHHHRNAVNRFPKRPLGYMSFLTNGITVVAHQQDNRIICQFGVRFQTIQHTANLMVDVLHRSHVVHGVMRKKGACDDFIQFRSAVECRQAGYYLCQTNHAIDETVEFTFVCQVLCNASLRQGIIIGKLSFRWLRGHDETVDRVAIGGIIVRLATHDFVQVFLPPLRIIFFGNKTIGMGLLKSERQEERPSAC